MTIKRIITGGCSFSDRWSIQTWPYRLKELLPNVSFRHTGMGSQGNDLIQKKISLAVIEELETYAPDELLVLPMWSGTERKAFYVDNPLYIKEIVNQWPKRGISTGLQFCNLLNSNNAEELTEIITKRNNDPTEYKTKYNPTGGWYHCNYLMSDSKLTDEYFKSANTIIRYATDSLENIIILQNLCKLKGISIYQSFYRTYVYDDIYQNKDHLNLNYLYKQLDLDTIVSTVGIYEHLRPPGNGEGWNMGGLFRHVFRFGDIEESKQYFESDNWHPNIKGSTKWVNEVLFPFLSNKNLF